MLAAWAVAAPELPDRAGTEKIVAAAGLPVDGMSEVVRADFLFGDEYEETPVWIGTDEYTAGSVTVQVRVDDQDAASISTSLVQSGWREPVRGDVRPWGGVYLGNDDMDLVLDAYVQDGTAFLRVFRQTPVSVWPVGVVAGALAAAATVALSQRLHARPIGQPSASRAELQLLLLGAGLALLAPGTLWGLAVLIAEGPLLSDVGATRPVPLWFTYQWWGLKPVSILGAALCASSALTFAGGGRPRSAPAAVSRG